MVNGLYTASRAMTNILAKQDVHAQNLANTSTNGFKLGRLVNTAEVAVSRDENGELKQKEMQQLSEVYTSFAQGPMVNSSNPLDVALSSSGFFMVKADNGETRYTRNGAFTLNADGDLVTLSGKKVLDEGGSPIHIDGDVVKFQEDGSVFVDGNKEATLGIVDFKDTKALRYGADGLFSNSKPETNPPLKPQSIGVRQGFLEGSNADPIATMVNMIADFRNYEADQKALKAVDETLGRAVNDVGKV